MKSDSLRILKLTGLISSLLAGVLWLVFFIQFSRGFDWERALEFTFKNPNICVYPLYCFFSIIILIRARSNQGVLFFSLFLSLLSQNIAIDLFYRENQTHALWLVLGLSFLLTSSAIIKSFQNFPEQISYADVDREISKNKLLRIYLKFCLKRSTLWIFTALVFILSVLFPGNVTMKGTVLILVLMTALLFLYLNYKISTSSNRNKIIWLFWGILCFTLLAILKSIVARSNPGMHEAVGTLFDILRPLSLFVSVTMCLFFFDTFDTGVLIRRTIVDGTLFIGIVLLYNSLEHYFLHWMSHKLHISSTLVSSVLSGFFVLVFSPVHHRFMRVLDGKFRRKETHKV